MKSLEARKADRAKRQEQAEADKETANEILRNGTGSQTDDGEGGEEGYDSWTVAELKSELDSREIEYASSDKKADLIKLLNDNDSQG